MFLCRLSAFAPPCVFHLLPATVEQGTPGLEVPVLQPAVLGAIHQHVKRWLGTHLSSECFSVALTTQTSQEFLKIQLTGGSMSMTEWLLLLPRHHNAA